MQKMCSKTLPNVQRNVANVQQNVTTNVAKIAQICNNNVAKVARTQPDYASHAQSIVQKVQAPSTKLSAYSVKIAGLLGEKSYS